jgi:hypothetical protein
VDRVAPRIGTWSKRLLALTGFVAGTVFGAVLQEALSTELRLLEGAIAILCLAVVGLTALLGEMERTAKLSHVDIVEHLGEVERITRDSLETFGKYFNLRVRCQMIRDTNNYHSPDQDLVVEAFRRAREEILVLDHLTDEGVRPDVDMNPQVMKWHLDTIESRAREGVVYRRYCQVANTERPFHNVHARAFEGRETENVFADHCISMSDMRSAAADVILKVSPNVYPYKFLIIDKSILILQLQEVDQAESDHDDPRTLCELIIDDPQRQLIDHFMKMWDKVENHPKTRAITASDPDLAILKGLRAGAIPPK